MVGSRVLKAATAARWKVGIENPSMWRLMMETSTDREDRRSRKISCCLSGLTGGRGVQDPSGEDARDELLE
jgi:hypothetical protein